MWDSPSRAECKSVYQLVSIAAASRCIIIISNPNTHTHTQVNGLPSMQLSNELGAPPDPTSSYTLTKFGLLHDTLQILFNASLSVAGELRKELEVLGVGVRPGPQCDPLRHVFCVDFKDLQKLADSKREYENCGNFRRIFPSPDGQKYSKLIYHMHKFTLKRFQTSGLPPPRTLWRTHYLYLALERLYSLRN